MKQGEVVSRIHVTLRKVVSIACLCLLVPLSIFLPTKIMRRASYRVSVYCITQLTLNPLPFAHNTKPFQADLF